MEQKHLVNPYLPSWEYIPDGEPYVFGDRVYVYGSHDSARGYVYCQNDYVCWSAPVKDLGNWRYEGVIYQKTQDPRNRDGRMCLYAPDVTRGPDGRYYLYYVLNRENVVSVAVCDTPAGAYQFYGYVHDRDGNLLGERPGDENQFDPGVLTEGDVTYLYTGLCNLSNENAHGPMVTVLESDMLTIREDHRFIMPSLPYAKGTAYEDHAFFEAPSIRKRGDTYYFIYSSVKYCEICYATSNSPVEGFRFGGVIVANNDVGVSSYKPAEMPMYYGGNNHGSIVEIEGQWYIFYHRHTNGTNFSRQACVERIEILPDGSIPQVEMTSCGGKATPLPGVGEYPAHIACCLTTGDGTAYTDSTGGWMDSTYPKITQDGGDDQECDGYVCGLRSGATVGYRYFALKDVTSITFTARCYARGALHIRTQWDGPVLATVTVNGGNYWTDYTGSVTLPDGVHPLYFTYEGTGALSLLKFTLA
ncbi:MAG: carbohydrate-binding protein [Clostridiales bacterium]|nr:carbohydrate-binding protein [Clostridiales bacterium]